MASHSKSPVRPDPRLHPAADQTARPPKKPGTPRLPIAGAKDWPLKEARKKTAGVPPSAPVSRTTDSERQSQMPPEQPVFNPRVGRLVTVKEAAFRLGKSEDTIHLWLRRGRLKGWQPGGNRCWILVGEVSLEEALTCAMQLRG